MKIQYFEPHTVRLCQYVIASADMYFCEAEQRDVFLGNDKYGHLTLWGEISGRGPSTNIDLCEIFLEYSLYCCSRRGAAEALDYMRGFGEQIGRSLAKYLIENPSLLAPENPAVLALEHAIEMMGARFYVEHLENETRFIVTDCPLAKAAERSGLRNVELARQGINSMCQSLIYAMDPNLNLNASSSDQSEFVFTISMPIPA
jgi:hypothetical protein